jgi:hypothetical protein
MKCLNWTVIAFVKFVKCVHVGHTVRIPDEIRRLATANPDNDYVVHCARCGMSAKAYFSQKRNRVRIYNDESGAIFGDVWRD